MKHAGHAHLVFSILQRMDRMESNGEWLLRTLRQSDVIGDERNEPHFDQFRSRSLTR